MKQKKGFFSNIYVRNIILAIAFIVLMMVSVNIMLNVVTRHGKELVVPDFSSMTFDEARREASKSGVRVYEGDSVYVPNMRHGAVYSQLPYAGSKVKKGRRIMLVTNTRVPQKVAMPNIVGFSMRQAKGELAGKGLKVGKLIYRHDIATNNVIGQQHNGKNIEPGEFVNTGTGIDLVLGLNPENSNTTVPNLIGKDYVRTREFLQDYYLNIGRVYFDSSVRNYADSARAVVYSQTPMSESGLCTMGTYVSVELTVDLSKVAPSDK